MYIKAHCVILFPSVVHVLDFFARGGTLNLNLKVSYHHVQEYETESVKTSL